MSCHLSATSISAAEIYCFLDATNTTDGKFFTVEVEALKAETLDAEEGCI